MMQMLSRARFILRHRVMRWVEWSASAIVWIIVIGLAVAAFI